MNKLSNTLIALLLVLSAATSWAQSSEENAAKAAEQVGKLREALTQYVTALQKVSESSGDDQRLRETIIKLVQKLSPPPAIPEEARRYSVRGQIAIKEAKSPADFEEAAKEFGKALRAAPWWADGYINQGVALEKAGKFTDAIRSLKFYLLAAPGAPDAEKIKEQIYALEYRQEKAGKETVAKKERDRSQNFVRSLVGSWEARISTISDVNPNTVRYAARVQGNSLEMTVSAVFDPPSNQWQVPNTLATLHNYRGTVDGMTITGTVTTTDFSRVFEGGRVESAPFSATISPDGKSIRISYVIAAPCGTWRYGGPGRRFGDPARGGGFCETRYSGEFRRQ